MPIVVPPFVQYQAPLPPLRGLWNSPPVEGDRFVSAEIDWGITTGPGLAVQFSLSGNSPVAFSQIVAFSVDNSKCASDTQFLFPDSAFILNVPAYNQGIFPVFTNALMFYVVSTLATVGDRTVFQVLNSMPPPVAINPTEEMTQASTSGVQGTNGTTQLIPAGVSGTIQGYDISALAFAAGSFVMVLQDGTGRYLLQRGVNFTASNETFEAQLSGLRLRFFNGLTLTVQNSTYSAAGQASIAVNIFYSLP